MKIIVRNILLTIAVIIVAGTASAQVGGWVMRGGIWVFEGVVQDQVLQRGVYPAWNYAAPRAQQGAIGIFQWGASDPMYSNGGNHANSTPKYGQQYQAPSKIQTQMGQPLSAARGKGVRLK